MENARFVHGHWFFETFPLANLHYNFTVRYLNLIDITSANFSSHKFLHGIENSMFCWISKVNLAKKPQSLTPEAKNQFVFPKPNSDEFPNKTMLFLCYFYQFFYSKKEVQKISQRLKNAPLSLNYSPNFLPQYICLNTEWSCNNIGYK